MMVKIFRLLLLSLLLCSTALPAHALSVYIPQPQADEVQLNKFEFVQLHLAILGYPSDAKALARFCKGHRLDRFLQLQPAGQKQPALGRQIELELVAPDLTEAYLWLGSLQYKRNYSSSGYLWLQAEVYRAQCLLNELGYEAGKPDGKQNLTYKMALIRFAKEQQLDKAGFATVLEQLEREAEKNAAHLPTVFLRMLPRQTGPWTYPETHPIVKKDYAAALYLAALGYPVSLHRQVTTDAKGRRAEVVNPVDLQQVLARWQNKHPQSSQTGGALNDKALAELAQAFRHQLQAADEHKQAGQRQLLN